MPLFRRREVWLPTWPLALLIVAALAGAVWWTGRHAYDLMATNEPAPNARTLVVEGWLSRADLQQARALRRSGRYDRVLTSGGPIDAELDVGNWRDYAARAAAILGEDTDSPVPVIAVPAPPTLQERTYLSAEKIGEWAARAGVRLDAIDVYTRGVHARRSRQVYRLALGDSVAVGVIVVPPSDYDGVHWWTSSLAAKTTLGEAVSLVWTTCCFWPPAVSPAGAPP